MNPAIAAMLPDVTCGCDIEARQAKVDEVAALYSKKPERLWHLPTCAVVIRIELRKVLEAIEADTDSMVLPDPVLEALQGERLAALAERRDGLMRRLDPGRKFAQPSRTVTGYDQATGNARTEPNREHTQ